MLESEEPMDAMVLDANAVAGDLEALLGFDATAAAHCCAACGNVSPMGTLLAFIGGPGTVLRCSVCREVVLRMVRARTGTLLDVRGAAYIVVGLTGGE
jgi:hypothetical protein